MLHIVCIVTLFLEFFPIVVTFTKLPQSVVGPTVLKCSQLVTSPCTLLANACSFDWTTLIEIAVPEKLPTEHKQCFAHQ